MTNKIFWAKFRPIKLLAVPNNKQLFWNIFLILTVAGSDFSVDSRCFVPMHKFPYFSQQLNCFFYFKIDFFNSHHCDCVKKLIFPPAKKAWFYYGHCFFHSNSNEKIGGTIWGARHVSLYRVVHNWWGCSHKLTEFLLANILNRTMKSKVRSHQTCRSSRKEEGGTKTVTSTLSVI